MTNCNLGAPMNGAVANGTNTGIYSYCNLLSTIGTGWTDGGHNIASPGLTPGYADLDTDWRYSNSTLMTADSAGGPIGSQLHWLVQTPVPVSLSTFWVE